MKNKQVKINQVYHDQKTKQKYLVKAIKTNPKTSETFVELSTHPEQKQTIVRPCDLFLAQAKLESGA